MRGTLLNHWRRQLNFLALTSIGLAITFCGCNPANTVAPATTNAPSLTMPNFPWPPPEASASMELPKEFLRGATNLSRADALISSALLICGYAERSYYQVPGGFALVTRLERTNPDGTPKSLPHRWSVDVSPTEKFALADYTKALATADAGRFRTIVFVLSSHSLAQSPTKTTGRQWLTNGVNALPKPVGDAAYSTRHACTVLVYEFDVPEMNTAAVLVKPSGLSCKVHLEKAMLWNALSN